ncbi:redoxin domain-containing protein [Paenibacillus aurantius]|uniref:Redoxin domain-containing protein n=1 Tax=Paenibacillus aurantius TaxID=2918900 RepID=A0AA96RDE6_9BACL|nr:redoxin domain-containing protein [Paenibacillus aurantius]WJH34233.1 redoxin domain-containing protein [Paenibacillus sp. CC-CFT747]WNQ09326.1 redoxin domain-containing protein [Paenibacillus aurantius]
MIRLGKRNKWVQISILVVVLVIGGLTMAGSVFKDDKLPRVGDKAPDFKLAGLDGQVHRLSDYKGKAVIVNFWGTFCEPCRKEMPDIQQQSKEWADSAVVLGVNVMGESKVTVKSFIDQVKVDFPILLDPDDATRRKYGVADFPTTFFINPEGKIVQIVTGPLKEQAIRQTLSAILKK